MEPRNIGRALGIGVRVAGRIAGRRIAGSAQPAANRESRSSPSLQSAAGATRATGPSPGVASEPSNPQPRPAPSPRPMPLQPQTFSRAAAETRRNVSKGVGGFLRPFRRVGGIVWLEATGTFFLLFSVLFALRTWQAWSRVSVVSRDFAIGASVVFLYLGVSSFWRARRR